MDLWSENGWTGRPSYEDMGTHLKIKRKKEMKNVPRGVHQMRLLPRHSLTDVVVLVVIDIVVVVGGGHLKSFCPQTSTAGVHQMRPLCRYSFIIIIIIVIDVDGHLKSFQPPKPRFLSFENNTDGQTDGWVDGHNLFRGHI